MGAPKPLEQELLQSLEQLIVEFTIDSPDPFELRLQILETVSSRIGIFSIEDYHRVFGVCPMLPYKVLLSYACKITDAISKVPIHYAHVLSSLSRQPLNADEQKKSGAYYTDYRVAKFLAEQFKCNFSLEKKIIDPACGTGSLLVAATISLCGVDRCNVSQWLANSVFAFDISSIALRGARLALASLTDDLEAIRSMWSNWHNKDSLLLSDSEWSKISEDGFDFVIANPPWEKLKITRHEFLKLSGTNRTYGEEYDNINLEDYQEAKTNIAVYANHIKERFVHIGKGEIDLYIAFLELSNSLVKQTGEVSILVPAGLIRSQSTEGLRKLLFNNSSEIAFSIFDNKARYFAIDTRFKFVAVHYSKRTGYNKSKRLVQIQHIGKETQANNKNSKPVSFEFAELERVFPDLSLPEVKNIQEWELFIRMIDNGVKWSNPDSDWFPEIVREVDMTSDKDKFSKEGNKGRLPIIEGRMVQAFRFGAKSYLSGSGRSAKWVVNPLGYSAVNPQFWIDTKSLTEKQYAKANMVRGCFCDITGQTNERSMMATIVPAGVMCGNKVPTVVFPNDSSGERLFLWVGIMNSLPFDWMIRKVITTTVNYFLLLSLSLPAIEPDSLPGRYVITNVKKLLSLDASKDNYNHWDYVECRSDIDLAILVGYGLELKHLELILKDFSLFDRGQPVINNEKKSTITADYLLMKAAKRFGANSSQYEKRVLDACKVGALPYVYAETRIKPNTEGTYVCR